MDYTTGQIYEIQFFSEIRVATVFNLEPCRRWATASLPRPLPSPRKRSSAWAKGNDWYWNIWKVVDKVHKKPIYSSISLISSLSKWSGFASWTPTALESWACRSFSRFQNSKTTPLSRELQVCDKKDHCAMFLTFLQMCSTRMAVGTWTSQSFCRGSALLAARSKRLKSWGKSIVSLFHCWKLLTKLIFF